MFLHLQVKRKKKNNNDKRFFVLKRAGRFIIKKTKVLLEIFTTIFQE